MLKLLAMLAVPLALAACNNVGIVPTNGSDLIALSSSTYAVVQGAGSVSVTVNRTGPGTTAATISYATANGTAVAGTDYTSAAGTLSWGSGDLSAKSITIPVSTATPFSGTRGLTVALSGATGSGLGAPASAVVTVTGSGVAANAGTLALAGASLSVGQAAGNVTVSVTRTGGSSGAASVHYSTASGTAVAGTDFTTTTGTLNWANGDAATKTFTLQISNTTPFAGNRAFAVNLSAATGGALGTPASATVTIAGSSGTTNGGSVAFTVTSLSVTQATGSLTVSVARTSGSSGAASVHYATANGSAIAGTDYTATSGNLNWAAADSASKAFTVMVNSATPFNGSRTFTLNLSAATGSVLGSITTLTVSINGSGVTGACSKNASSWTTTGAFDSNAYGNYVVNNNNWGGTPNQQFWSNNESCWGVTTSATTEQFSVSSYPSVTRGWSQNASIMQALSTSGTNDWTTKSGMGIAVSQLTKAGIHWAFNAPTASGSRWLGLMDIYFHSTPRPTPSEFPPVVDLMIDQSLMDQLITGQPPNLSSFYALTASQDNGTVVTLGGVRYLLYIDDVDELAYSQPAAGGHTIHLFEVPTAFTDSTGASWGVQDGRHNLKAIIDYFRQANPLDDAGKPLKRANGSTVTSPLISASLYLNAINAGWEIDVGTSFTNTGFCVAMQSEADCP